MNRFVVLGTVCLASAANAQLIADFESPAFVGSASGVLVSNQGGWYLPSVAGAIDQLVFTYAGNALGIAANPTGGSQFLAGRSSGGTALARAQHDFDFSTANTWTLAHDFACAYDGITPITPNLASFSLNHPSLPSGYKQYIALHNFMDTNDATLGWKLEFNVSDAAGLALLNQSPGAEFMNLLYNHWYRESVTVDFSTNRITSISLTDLTTNVTVTATPDWYVSGGASSTLPLPPSVRFFAGGATAGSIAAFDNLSVTSSGCAADFNGDGVVDFFDYLDFVDAFSANAPSADFNNDGVIDFFDYLDFVDAFAGGC